MSRRRWGTTPFWCIVTQFQGSLLSWYRATDVDRCTSKVETIYFRFRLKKLLKKQNLQAPRSQIRYTVGWCNGNFIHIQVSTNRNAIQCSRQSTLPSCPIIICWNIFWIIKISVLSSYDSAPEKPERKLNGLDLDLLSLDNWPKERLLPLAQTWLDFQPNRNNWQWPQLI